MSGSGLFFWSWSFFPLGAPLRRLMVQCSPGSVAPYSGPCRHLVPGFAWCGRRFFGRCWWLRGLLPHWPSPASSRLTHFPLVPGSYSCFSPPFYRAPSVFAPPWLAHPLSRLDGGGCAGPSPFLPRPDSPGSLRSANVRLPALGQVTCSTPPPASLPRVPPLPSRPILTCLAFLRRFTPTVASHLARVSTPAAGCLEVGPSPSAFSGVLLVSGKSWLGVLCLAYFGSLSLPASSAFWSPLRQSPPFSGCMQRGSTALFLTLDGGALIVLGCFACFTLIVVFFGAPSPIRRSVALAVTNSFHGAGVGSTAGLGAAGLLRAALALSRSHPALGVVSVGSAGHMRRLPWLAGALLSVSRAWRSTALPVCGCCWLALTPFPWSVLILLPVAFRIPGPPSTFSCAFWCGVPSCCGDLIHTSIGVP